MSKLECLTQSKDENGDWYDDHLTFGTNGRKKVK